MKIVDMLSKDLIIADLSASSRDEVLDELVACIVSANAEIDAESALSVLRARERIASTGIGQGLAIPHARLPNLVKPIACFARSTKGIDFKALDGAPTHLFLALLAPSGAAGFHLKALARASRMFKDAEFRSSLLDINEPGGLWAAIVTKDNALSVPPP